MRDTSKVQNIKQNGANKMILKFIENIGDKTMNSVSTIYDLIKFSFLCLIHLPNPYSYNPDMRKTVIKQIYYTALKPLPSFMIMAFIFGTLIIGMVIVVATKFNLQLQTGSIIVTFAINEFAPLFTAFFIAFKSGVILHTKVHNKSKRFQEHNINIIDNLFLPHIISGMLSTVLLAALFAIILISGGYIISLFYLNMDFHTYSSLIVNATEVRDIMILLLKGTAFGFVTMLISISSGLNLEQTDISIAISVSNLIVKLFIAILFIEMVSLVIQLI